MLVKKHTTEDVDLDITCATLLSIEEAEQIPLELRKYNNWWWLLSPGYNSLNAALVDLGGSVYSYGNYVTYDCVAVRPALKISNLESSDIQIGDVFEFGGKEFEVVSNNLAFCLTEIGNHCFRKDREAKDANDYEKSDVKKFIDDWFDQSVQENDYPCRYFDGREEKVYLTDFQKGIWFARTGKHIDYIYKTVGRCRGTKNMEGCNCDGDRSRCDFHSR